jgi:WD40 repeat protein
MSRIFLSHSSRNNPAALALANWLESKGWHDYFLDISEHRGIAPGERWMAALAGAVDRCEAVIFLVSPAWLDSEYCFAEFYQAKNLGKRIFGVIVEPIALSKLPQQLTAEWQVCDLTHSEGPVAFSVEQLPLVPQTVVSFPAFGLDALARGLQKAGLDPSYFKWPPDADPDRSPYPGLRALDDLDAAVFFGREAAIVRAIDQVRQIRERDVERLFVILGASGAGKSSFLRAGLLPRLRRDSDHFVVLQPIRPERAAISGSHGLLAVLASGLAQEGQALSLAELRNALTDTGLSGVLRRIAARPIAQNTQLFGTSRTVIVPIDQTEELFAADAGAEAVQLLKLIHELRRRLVTSEPFPAGEHLRVLFVATIRSDSLSKLQIDATLQSLAPVFFSLPAMPVTEFKAVIEGPARRHTETVKPLSIAPQLTERLMADAKGADALPLLALTLEWLYREFTTDKGTRLEWDKYQSLGGIGGVINKAVARALEQPGREPVIPAQSPEQERLLEQLFPFLATVDPYTRESKRRVALRAAIRGTAPQADALVERLIEQRLLVSDFRQMPEAAEPVEVVEVAHEALLRQWGTLERWLRSFADDLAAVESIRRAAVHWESEQRNKELLVHTGHRLQAAEALLADELFKRRFEVLDEQYLAACRERDRSELLAREERLQQIAEQQAKLSEQQAKRAADQRRASWGLSLALVALLFLVGLIVQQSRDVGRQTSLVYASAAEAATDRHEADRGVRLAVLANHATWLGPPHATAHPALATAADSNLLRVLLRDGTSISSFSLSADSKRIVTSSSDGTAQVWDAESGMPLGEPMRHENYSVNHAAFSPDGRRVVTASDDYTARLWDAQSGQALGEPMRHQGPVAHATFSPDGRRVVTASWDYTARLWDAQSGQALGEPMRHEDAVFHAAFSPDGRRVVTASRDNTARLWDAQSGQALGEPMRHEETVSHAAFSPDGRRVVTASDDNTARLWDAQSGQALGEPMRHESTVNHAAFSPDGRRVVTASYDKTARLWNAQSGKPTGQPMRHEIFVKHAAFSPDGRRVVTASGDSTARFWRTDWSAFASTEALLAAACARMNPTARHITEQDRRLVPLIPPELLGKDVCELPRMSWFR